MLEVCKIQLCVILELRGWGVKGFSIQSEGAGDRPPPANWSVHFAIRGALLLTISKVSVLVHLMKRFLNIELTHFRKSTHNAQNLTNQCPGTFTGEIPQHSKLLRICACLVHLEARSSRS